MSDANAKIVAENRESFGKGAARKYRAKGRTPAVIYGHGSEPRHITLPAHEVALVLRHKNAVIDLTIDGKQELVLVKSATKDVITQVIEHIDLVTILKGEKVHVEVPVHVVGETLSGTTLDLEHKTVKVSAEATNIPEFVEVVLNKEGEGHHVLAKDIKLPAGVTMDLDADELIASVVATGAGASEGTAAPAAEAAAE
jgi:large subunit ribosomal protein L25